MKAFQTIVFFSWLAGAAFAQQGGPHLAYVYPAGGKVGTTFQITVGGQFLAAVSNAFITGPGVTATGWPQVWLPPSRPAPKPA